MRERVAGDLPHQSTQDGFRLAISAHVDQNARMSPGDLGVSAHGFRQALIEPRVPIPRGRFRGMGVGKPLQFGGDRSDIDVPVERSDYDTKVVQIVGVRCEHDAGRVRHTRANQRDGVVVGPIGGFHEPAPSSQSCDYDEGTRFARRVQPCAFQRGFVTWCVALVQRRQANDTFNEGFLLLGNFRLGEDRDGVLPIRPIQLDDAFDESGVARGGQLRRAARGNLFIVECERDLDGNQQRRFVVGRFDQLGGQGLGLGTVFK